MNKEQTRNVLIIGGIGLAAFFLLRKKEEVPQVIRTEVAPAESPDSGQWIPGENNPQILYGPGGAPFIVVGGNTTINVPDVMLGALSRQYIPMFGFAGVAAIGSQ